MPVLIITLALTAIVFAVPAPETRVGRRVKPIETPQDPKAHDR